MAVASQVHLSLEHAGICHTPNIRLESAEIGSQVLQENHERHHVFFNEAGFHNHISHHVLTLYALGATPSEIQKAFDDNKGHQRPPVIAHENVIENLSDKETFRKFLGQDKYFHDYVVFFEEEMAKKGWQAVVNEYLLSRDENAEELLVRMFAGALHPMIHLGFGIEFKQPAIVAEALAEAAVHGSRLGHFLLGAEREAAAASSSNSSAKTLVELIHEARENDVICTAARWSDENKIHDGIFKHAAPQMTSLVAQWRVQPDKLEQKTAEMINANAYFAGGAQNPEKEVKFDFIYMHCINCSVFFSALLKEGWMKVEDQVRLLEWKGRLDLLYYASRGCPELRTDEITKYTPREHGMGWDEIIRNVNSRKDDGHVAKLIRALKNGEVECKPYELLGDDGFPIRGEMWLKLAQMGVDSTNVGAEEVKWAGGVGFSQAWEKVPDRARL